MSRYLIRAMILPMTDAQDFYPQGEIAIDGDRIVSVGERGTAPAGFNPDRVLNLTNHVVMPGLINTHTHAAMTLLRGYADDMPLMPWLQEKVWPFEDKMTPEDIYWGSSLALCEMLRSGTTTMTDMYISEEETARAVLESGTRALLSRGMIEHNKEAGNRSLQENIELFRKYHNAGDGRIKIMFGPHAPYTCSGEFLLTVKQEADRLGTGIHIHLAETQSELVTIRERYGTTPLCWLEQQGILGGQMIAAHCVYLNDAELDILKKYNVGVAHNPESNMKLSSGTARIPEMLKRGITVGLGTDGTSSNNDLDMFGEMRSASFQQKLVGSPEDLKAYEVLRMATTGGATVAGLKDLGKLQPGYKADIISIDFDQPHFYPRFSIPSHLVYCARGGDVRTAIVDGKILMEDGRLLTLDEQKICREAEKRARRIASEV
ncbi:MULTISPECIES: amidohydrolase [Dehalobacter]|uniref:5-methylthioadenosine/S-adenosylhomocysteine deaminase n=1 Tax=Dehalobacter restrictus TaxID=55583 RepID=A0A857DIY7_9FIRM|nr:MULTISPECIES: amidohydrolase [Dehalobacter]AFV03169.1 S-adenosylhomocysteine deaminase; Methylthioadenosine deaminase [Dehalobacter sp. DCA]AFV06158.1 S-adenosylhomocysteine deaminase; Methylthioadenosine deaminase [Dehalobacter sp. CF]EQB21186.1 S-adenosylhomocysteine deaminase [Dehalobacter sp. UNSWDHB]QHA00156.1 amidohydrolase family protein [Dehalobacter restrictus]